MMWEVNAAITLAGFHVPGETVELRVLAIAEGARVLFNRITAVWPVDTGRSLAGFRTTQEANTWYVRNPVDYSPYVHSHPNQGGPPGLADRAVVRAMPAATAAARRELKRVVEVSQTVGARGRFQLRQRTPTSPGPTGRGPTSPFPSTLQTNIGRAQQHAAQVLMPAAQRIAVAEATAVIAPLVEANTAPLGVAFMIRGGMLRRAAEVLRETGRTREARQLEQIAARRAA